MTHKIVDVEVKSNDWKMVSIQMSPDSILKNVSVNRSNKKGEVFPNFDGVIAGALVEGELWESGSSKWYLFAPKQRPVRGPSAAPAAITKAQDHKAELIGVAQDRKQEAIQKAGAMRDATLFTVEVMKQAPFPTDDEIKAEWTKWYKFFMGKAEEPFV